jgi:hypothetical protein
MKKVLYILLCNVSATLYANNYSDVMQKFISARVRSEACLNFSCNIFKNNWEMLTLSLITISDPRQNLYDVDIFNNQYIRHSKAANESTSVKEECKGIQNVNYSTPLDYYLFSPESKEKAALLFYEIRKLAVHVRKMKIEEKGDKDNLFYAARMDSAKALNYVYPINIQYEVENNNQTAFRKHIIEKAKSNFTIMIPLAAAPSEFDTRITNDPRENYLTYFNLKEQWKLIVTDSAQKNRAAELANQLTEIEKKLQKPLVDLHFVAPLASQTVQIKSQLKEFADTKLPSGFYRNWANDLLARMEDETNLETQTKPQPFKGSKEAFKGLKDYFNGLNLQTSLYIIMELIPVLIAHDELVNKMYDLIVCHAMFHLDLFKEKLIATKLDKNRYDWHKGYQEKEKKPC